MAADDQKGTGLTQMEKAEKNGKDEETQDVISAIMAQRNDALNTSVQLAARISQLQREIERLKAELAQARKEKPAKAKQ
jgi:uncharacterized small protein (DUF1192 family)